jgi:23S rRNA pseudouridine1911/1915/1917 synthase
MKFIVKSDMTLLNALKQFYPESSLNTLKSWIKEGRISLDEKPAKRGNLAVLEGQQIELNSKSRYIEGGLRLLHEESDLVVIDKPSGLLSVATAFDKTKTAHAYLKSLYRPRPVYVVHRLDQETSGVMLFVLNGNMFKQMKKIFETHKIDRVYYALVEGNLKLSSGTWQSYLYEDANYYVHSTPIEGAGALAVTHYEVKAANKLYSLLELRLETGRKNQIRVHCQQAGHPIIGDKKYGAHKNPLKRLGLHAHQLAFVHPSTKKKMVFTSPVPESFLEIL